jgi:hypothetical protein
MRKCTSLVLVYQYWNRSQQAPLSEILDEIIRMTEAGQNMEAVGQLAGGVAHELFVVKF